MYENTKVRNNSAFNYKFIVNWPVEKFEESSSEWEREEGVQNRVDARVGVSQHVAADLDIRNMK